VPTVDELPLLSQPRFLRFLDQDRAVRVVASAASDLLLVVERGHFRRDLAERLTLIELELPRDGGSR
jgi:DNA-binding NtrC family response regulator